MIMSDSTYQNLILIFLEKEEKKRYHLDHYIYFLKLVICKTLRWNTI